MTAAVAAAISADELLRRCLAAYPGHGEGGGCAADASIRRVAEHLNAADSEALVCIICLELLKRKDAVWSCTGGCFDTVHLSCVQAWARQQMQAAAAKLDSPEARHAAPVATWCCPKCRCEYGAGEVPTQYWCHCGKEVDPTPDLWLPAHTCGETCGRELACHHSCSLLCHPGPCPACPRMVQASCHCGKEETQRRCHQSSFSCNKLCGRRHTGCPHRCPHKCHEGPCPPCGLSARRTCVCGAETAVVPCAAGEFHCSSICNHLLVCGNHRCRAVCHAGECVQCPLTGPRPCPCGKTMTEGLSCEDPTPTCGDTCGKALACGLHRCTERCHAGPCPDVCRVMTTKECACGNLQKGVPCCEELRCQRKCSRMRVCARHACRRRCCDGSCPRCQEECGRLLKCGNHRCKAACHSGACLPCTREVRVACACATTSYRLPCGWEARARPPACTQPCPVARSCRHAAQLPPHKCHFGACPPCPHACGQLLGCGHGCAAQECHDAAPPAVPSFQQPAPPQQSALEAALGEETAPAASAHAAEVAAQLAAAGPGPCPTCQAPVKRWCQGFHSLLLQPCSDTGLKGCGQPCSRLLGCGSHFHSGEHRCSLACHPRVTPDGGCEGMPAGNSAEPGCEVCTLDCGRVHERCGHNCEAKCHAGACAECTVEITQACHCGKTTLTHSCHALTEPRAQEALMCCDKRCLRPLPNCPHACESTCHVGPCPGAASCEQEVTVRCGCRRLKAKWACHQVQAVLQRGGGGGGTYDGPAALRLLPCDAQCKTAQPKNADVASPVAEKRRSPAEPAPAPQQSKARQRQRASGRGSGGGSQEAGGSATMEVISQKWRKLRRQVKRNAVPVAIVGIGLLCALFMYKQMSA